MSTPYTISVVCTGNICRSPMGEAILRDAIATAGLADAIAVESAGTGDWHVGGGADHRAEEVIAKNRLSLAGHRAGQFTRSDFDRVDLILALDESHVRFLRTLAATDEDRQKVRLLRSFDPEAVEAGDLEVNDPYYGDYRDFEITYENITGATPGLIDYLKQEVAAQL